jgi:hypothetical protein
MDTDGSVPAGSVDLTGVGLAADFECEILGVGFDADR